MPTKIRLDTQAQWVLPDSAAEPIVDWNYTIKPDWTKAYFSFDWTDYDFANNKIKDNWPYTSNDWTLTNFARNDWTVSGGVTIEGNRISVNSAWAKVTIPHSSILNPTSWLAIFFESNQKTNTFSSTQRVLEKLWVWTWYFIVQNPSLRELEFNIWSSQLKTSNNIFTLWENNKWFITSDINWLTKIYLNNTEVASWTFTTKVWDIDTTSDLCLWNRISEGRPFEWEIWTMRIWNTSSFTEAERTAELNSNYAVKSDWLIAQYSWRNFAWTEANPSIIRDTNMIVSNWDREGISFNWVDNYIWDTWTWSDLDYTKTFTFFWEFVYNWKSNINTIATTTSLNTSRQWILIHINTFNTTDRRLLFNFWDADGAVAVSSPVNQINIGEIYDFVATYNAETREAKLSINWELVASRNIERNFFSNQNFQIWQYAWLRHFDWNIYDIWYQERLWSEEEIKAYSLRSKKLFSDNNWTSGNFGVSGKLTTNKLNARDLPTSATGLEAWDIWIDTSAWNVLKIVS